MLPTILCSWFKRVQIIYKTFAINLKQSLFTEYVWVDWNRTSGTQSVFTHWWWVHHVFDDNINKMTFKQTNKKTLKTKINNARKDQHGHISYQLPKHMLVKLVDHLCHLCQLVQNHFWTSTTKSTSQTSCSKGRLPHIFQVFYNITWEIFCEIYMFFFKLN